MENHTHEPPVEAGTQPESAETAGLPAPAPPTPTIRHDGWTGEKMAIFCETLAETAVVAEACEAARMGISGAYACRRRNPVFAAAWDAALTIARERLADTLLARSMEGNVEQIWRDGEVVGERHLLDNRLGLAILKRLDRLAEATRARQPVISVRPERSLSRAESRGREAPAPVSQPFDWTLAVDALRTGDDAAVCQALALVEEPALGLSKGHEVEEVEDHPFFSREGDTEEEEIDLSLRCWKSDCEGLWMTDFPPPADFTGYQSCEWGDREAAYERECTPQEVAILEADAAADRAAARAEEEALRDSWFEMLKAGLAAAPPVEPVEPVEDCGKRGGHPAVKRKGAVAKGLANRGRAVGGKGEKAVQ